jgi:uncharacterized protein YxjI
MCRSPQVVGFDEADDRSGRPIWVARASDVPGQRSDLEKLDHQTTPRQTVASTNANIMRYVMKQKFWSWGDDFAIRDEGGREIFKVDGRAFSWGDKLSFQDTNGGELAFIRQKLLSWGPTYEIEVHGRLAAVVKKELFTFFRCKFSVDVPGPDDLEAQGDFLDHEYAFERQGRAVAQISKRWFNWTDTYGVDIAEAEDDVLILASAVVIDMVCHQESKRH